MKKIVITGQSGFIGSHLYRKALCSGIFECIDFHRECFDDGKKLKEKLFSADAVIHLAGLSRHGNGQYLYDVNTRLAKSLAEAADGHTFLYSGSTVYEDKDSFYHASKRETRRIFTEYGNCGILLMPNAFGPGSRPFYNSVVSTFCFLAVRGETPERIDDVELSLIGIDDLCTEILKAVRDEKKGDVVINPTFTIPLPLLWEKFLAWAKGEMPCAGADVNELELFETFRSYKSF